MGVGKWCGCITIITGYADCRLLRSALQRAKAATPRAAAPARTLTALLLAPEVLEAVLEVEAAAVEVADELEPEAVAEPEVDGGIDEVRVTPCSKIDEDQSPFHSRILRYDMTNKQGVALREMGQR